MMSYSNRLKFSLPYFASKENQTVYVAIPAVNPALFKQSHEDIVNFSTEEEILPDFRCKICSVRISTYSEFKVHQQDHEVSEVDELKKSYFLEADRIQLLNSNCGLKLNLSENFENNTKFDSLKHSSQLRIVQSTNEVRNKIFPSKIASNALQEEYKRHLSSSKTTVSLNNSICSSNNSKISACSKFKETLEMQNEMLETELKKSNSSKLPVIQRLNKCGTYAPSSKFSNSTDANSSHAKDIYSKSTSNNENSSICDEIHLSTISRENIQGPIPAAESSDANVTLTLTYTGLKQFFTPCKKKKVAAIIKPHSTSFYQSQSTTLSADSKDSETEINQKRSFGIRVNQTMNELDGSFSTFNSLAYKSKYSAVNYFENDIAIADNIKGESLVFDKGRPSNSDLPSLQSMDMSDHSVLFLKPLSNAKEIDKLPVKKTLAYKESFLNGIFPEVLSEKGTKQMIDKFDDSISASQPLGSISSSDVTTCSEYEIHTEKTKTDEVVKYDDDSSPLKKSSLLSESTSDRDVYILDPSTNVKEKPMRCFYCRKTFQSCAQMRRHLLLHEESKSVFCDVCNLFFTRISTFRSHLLIFHCQSKDGKKCPYCDYRCFRSSNLENHLVRVHFKYKCTFCTKRFATLKELNTHLDRKHLY